MKTKYSSSGSGRRFSPGVVALIVMATALLAGCSAMPETAPEAEPALVAGDVGEYKVIFAPAVPRGKPTVFTGSLTRPLTVQDTLVESRALDKFKGMRIDLARRAPAGGQVLKLPVLFDPATRRVLEEQNYAIHPGDELLIRKENQGALDFVFKSLRSGDGGAN